MNQQIFNELETINKLFHYKTENILNYITKNLNSISKLESRITDLDEEIDSLTEQVQDRPNCFEYPDGFQDNIVTVSALEKMFANLDRIPVDKLDEFVDKYAV